MINRCTAQYLLNSNWSKVFLCVYKKYIISNIFLVSFFSLFQSAYFLFSKSCLILFFIWFFIIIFLILEASTHEESDNEFYIETVYYSFQ